MTTPDASDRITALRRQLGRTGIWSTPPDAMGVDARDLAATVEQYGFGSLWLGGSHMAPDAFTQLVALLDGSTKLIVGTGIASIWGREPSDMRQGADTLSKGFPGRFILGLGVAHRPAVESLGRSYAKPYSAMERYLEEMDHPAGHPGAGPGEAPADAPGDRAVRVLAALGPRMLELSRDEADGAHPYFSPVDHTSFARQVLGPDKLLIPEQAVVLAEDAEPARAAARAYAQRYLEMPNYTSNLRRFGFGDPDIGGGGSDRLIDAIIPHGPAVIAERVRQHLAAGADTVLLQPVGPDGRFAFGDLGPLAEALSGL
ncbi:MAG: TIGR03620 family F420-dependent LLM class oxidoreductase [Actinobacteria bacterium]|nr:TIGR03620 family F420-dependent LLM class oxidoreductase [Actinomycetota bacterium]